MGIERITRFAAGKREGGETSEERDLKKKKCPG